MLRGLRERGAGVLRAAAGLGLAVMVACAPAAGPAPKSGGKALSGTVKADGSSTVFPISEAMAGEFQKANPGVRVTVGVSGTGGGFKKLTTGETDISDAS